MSEQNGSSPTTQTIDGITIDLNRATRREFREYVKAMREATETGNSEAGDAARGVFYAKIILAWPFGEKGYDDLGVLDAKRVDDAVNEAMELIAKKKSESLLIPLENSTGA